jgi:hypothetical protein
VKPFYFIHGPRVVVLFFSIAFLAAACTKGKDTSTPLSLSPLDSTHKLAGIWAMRGFEDTDQIDTYDKTYALPDTNMAINVVNDSTITLNNLVFNYTAANSNDSMLYFWHIFHGDIFEEASVSYYFRKDSVVYEHLILVIPDGYQEKFYHTY